MGFTGLFWVLLHDGELFAVFALGFGGEASVFEGLAIGGGKALHGAGWLGRFALGPALDDLCLWCIRTKRWNIYQFSPEF